MVSVNQKSKSGTQMQDLSSKAETIKPLDSALKLSMPAWPLQNTVAVNPFWNRRDESFHTVMDDLSPIVHSSLYMPLAYFLDQYRVGAISDEALVKSLKAAQSKLKSVPQSIDDLVRLSTSEKDTTRQVLSIAEAFDQTTGSRWSNLIIDQVSKYAGAYFDDGQAVASFPWRKESFWQGWCSAQIYDASLERLGIKGFRATIAKIKNFQPISFIDHALSELSITDHDAKVYYLSRLMAAGLGWASQFKYCEWQRSLGYQETPDAKTIDYLAVLVAYDYALACCLGSEHPTLLTVWQDSLKRRKSKQDVRVHAYELHEIWQKAAEISYQNTVARALNPLPILRHGKRPRAQIVFCIDVRSEMLRRALENTSSDIETIGFAGFFGIPIDYQRIDEKNVGHRLPVLLKPAYSVEESLEQHRKVRVQEKALKDSFIRNLRKAPLASFAYVELFGIYAVGKLLYRTISGTFAGKTSSLPSRFALQAGSPSPLPGDDTTRIERALAVLRHMGLTKNFAKLVIIAGHGNASTNNAFASALDCGACGGHAGDINARILCDLLNAPEVRRGLAQHQVQIPEDTWFLPALHETVTDRLHLLDLKKLPAGLKADLSLLEADLKEGSEIARKERQTARSHFLDHSPERRMASWSEIRPEWGLAGNACFIVAPRSLTRGVNLSSRAFLHDYHAKQDEGFATLELIMTAPMVVTNWINLQYYASTVAPHIWGAGDKTLHNLVNESGVQEGNGGDLRIGLPIQSVHDGDKFVHEPLRLSVFIAAPREAIEAIIQKHAVVRELVDNEWLLLLHIDEETGAVTRRLPGGLYQHEGGKA